MSKKAEILLVLKDKFTDPIKKATQSQETFAEKTRELNKRLDELNGRRISLKVDLARATKDMNDAKKAYLQLNDEVSRTNYEKALEQHESLKKQLAAVEEQSKAASRGLSDLRSEASKLDNMGGGGSAGGEAETDGGLGGVVGITGAIMSSQLVGQLTGSVADYLGASITSAYGSGVGETVSNIGGGLLSGAGAGATMGMAAGPWGIAIGAAVGAVVGTISGIFKDSADKMAEKDDYFRNVVTNIYDEVLAMRSEMVSIGSSLAAERETNLTAFSTLLRNETMLDDNAYGPTMDAKTYADKFMRDVVEYARTTPFAYEELVNISKTLLTYGYASDRIIPMLTQIGDAGAALGWDASAKVSAATYIGRMSMSDKVTMQYLNPLIAQGLDVIGYIRQSLEHDNEGITNADVMEMVSKGLLSGKAVSEVLLEYMGFDFGGAMEELQNSFDGLQSTLEDWESEMQAAVGEGYNERRKEQMKAQIEWYEKHADELTNMYRMVGEYEAEQIGQQEENMRLNMDLLLSQAKDITDPSEMSQELYNAIVDAKVDYYNSAAYDELYDSQKALVNRIQNDLAHVQYDCGYSLGQEFSKGYESALYETRWDAFYAKHIDSRLMDGINNLFGGGSSIEYFGEHASSSGATYAGGGGHYAYGLDRVPYDNFPAMLHEGERVLTAAQARAADAERGGARNMTINIYNPTVRDDSDIDAIANTIYERLAAADATYVG